MIRYLCFFLLSTQLAFSETLPATMPAIVPGNDASLAYLSIIFGTMHGVLYGGSTHIVGYLSHMFSTVMFCVAGCLWTYTVFIGILNTASDGQFLGQKWSSLWVPVRTVMGICLLIPKGTTGYSLIQVLVMSVVLKGVGIANLAWHASCDYLKNGGVIVESIRLFPKEGVVNEFSETFEREKTLKKEYIDKAVQILKSEVCMMLYEQRKYSTQPRQFYVEDFSSTLNYSGYPLASGRSLNTERVIRFPAKGKTGVCGAIRWTTNSPNTLIQESNQVAIETLVKSLLSPARTIANIILRQSENNEITANNDIQNALQQLQYPLVHIVEGCYHTLNDQSRRLASNEPAAVVDWNKLKRGGWIMAGLYHSHLAKANQVTSRAHTLKLDEVPHISVEPPDLKYIQTLLSTNGQRNAFEVFLGESSSFTDQVKSSLIDYHASPWFGQDEYPTSPKYLDHWLLKPFQQTNELLHRHMRSVLNYNQDAISSLSNLGRQLLQGVSDLWEKIYREKLDLRELLDHPTQKILEILPLMPLIIIWMTLNFVMGSIFLYYIPLVPFLLFFFSSLSWLMLVITAILSAPLMALGLMHPEGHDFFGQAEQGVRLLFGLFLRPILMVFGFILAMVLSRISFEFFNYGYSVVIQNIIPFEGWLLSGVSQIALLAIYMSASLMIINRCFGLIYELPNKALSWIGWQTDGQNESEILHQVKGSMDQYASSVAREVTANTSSGQTTADVTLRGTR